MLSMQEISKVYRTDTEVKTQITYYGYLKTQQFYTAHDIIRKIINKNIKWKKKLIKKNKQFVKKKNSFSDDIEKFKKYKLYLDNNFNKKSKFKYQEKIVLLYDPNYIYEKKKYIDEAESVVKSIAPFLVAKYYSKSASEKIDIKIKHARRQLNENFKNFKKDINILEKNISLFNRFKIKNDSKRT